MHLKVLLAPRPSWCDSEPAPDPRDVVWRNIAVPKHMVSDLLRERKSVIWGKMAVGSNQEVQKDTTDNSRWRGKKSRLSW